MTRVSSKTTFYYKRVFPIFFIGFLVVVPAATVIISYSNGQNPPLPFFVIPIVMAIFVYFLFRKLLFDLADEVFDAGDALVVRKNGKEDRVALADIMNVSYSVMVNPPRVTLSLRRPSIFGSEVSFCPPIRFVPFARSPVIDQLIARVDAARQRQKG